MLQYFSFNINFFKNVPPGELEKCMKCYNLKLFIQGIADLPSF